jgi:2-haloacid dehalogenase
MNASEISSSPSIVVFDVGNVLLRWDPMTLYRKIFPVAAEAEWFLANICTMDWNLEQDRGRTWAEGVDFLTRLYPEWASQIAAYNLRWPEMLSGSISGSVAILKALKARGDKVYAITNFSSEKWAEAQIIFPFLTLFDGAVVSAHEKLLKPDHTIYHRLLERYDLNASDCLFVDDSEKNVLAARAVGMHAHHFVNAEGFAAKLEAYDIFKPVVTG